MQNISESHAISGSDNRIFYGWYIVGVVFFANFISVGTGFYAFNAFMEPLCELRGWTRTDFNMAISFGSLFGLFGQLIYGTLVVRTGSRILMFLGAPVAGIAFMMLTRVDTLWQFYLFCALLFIGNGAYGGIVAGTAVNNWFIKKRGRAIGIATTGISLSGAILPLTAMVLIIHTSLQQASFWIGIAVFTVGPIAWFIVRNWPEDCGLLPDGEANSNINTKPHENEENSWPLSLLIRNNIFWKIGIAYAMIMVGTVGVMSQLKPHFVDQGFDDMTAMWMMAATAFMGAIGKYFWGMLCDRFDPRRVVTILALANGVGLALSLYHGSLLVLVLFIAVFGFTMGGVMSTYPIIVAHFFGRESFASVLKFISLFLILQLAGFIIAGKSFDISGSYDPAYMIFVILDLLAAILLFSIKQPEKVVH